MDTSTDRIHVGSGTQIGPLTLFPVWLEKPSPFVFDVAPSPALRVSELPNATIDKLGVTSTSHFPILLTEGTLLQGGFQTRVVNQDILVPAEASRAVPTNCVEAGRWGGTPEHKAEGQAPARVRASIRTPREPDPHDPEFQNHQRQLRVWGSVRSYEESYGASEHANLADIMQGKTEAKSEDQSERRRRAQGLVRMLNQHLRAPLPGQRGILVGLNGYPLLLETIASERTFKKHVRTLSRALASDAATFEEVPTPSRRARQFAAAYSKTVLEPFNEDAGAVLWGSDGDVLTIRSLMAVGSTGAHLHSSAINSKHELVLV